MNEFDLRDELRKKRESIKTFDELVEFLKYVKENCDCGYGETPRAMAQASVAVAWYLAKEFGITGFQAGFVMWDFIRDWMYKSNETGMRIINYDDMLYPQYNYKFQKTISSDTWKSLQETAKKKIEKDGEADYGFAHPEVRKHWESIANGNIPFGYTVSDK